VEDAILPGCHGCVVETAGVDRDLIPTTNRVETIPRPMSGANGEIWNGSVEGAERVTEAVMRGSASEGRERQA